ncbi:hypothetical protein BLFGPEAP_01239 [Candidatus Methanoperedenaceae archaeon GB50]|nr:hypothetical protein BLFGPEAP_01239 [Candidatus Methanoperedenaceae archaeon GB50]
MHNPAPYVTTLLRPPSFCNSCLDVVLDDCNDPLEGGHISALKVDVIRQPPDNNFDKTSSQIQVDLNSPKPNVHIHGYTLQSNLLLPLLLLLSL